MPRLPRLTASEVIRVVEKRGFVLTRTRGSHQIFRNPSSGRRVTIPFHRGKVIPTGTLLNILRESGIDRDELETLLK
jgi:predicted RNA binding protein YcfA (HicA-like mRNA interferase family)